MVPSAAEALLLRAYRPAESISLWPPGLGEHVGENGPSRETAERDWGLKPVSLRIGAFVGGDPPTRLAETLSAFSLLRRTHPEAQLLIADRFPPAAQSLVKNWLAAEQPPADTLVMVPEPGDEDLASFLALCDQFWVPDQATDSANGLLQALAAGVPVIASRTDLIADLIVDGENGLLVAPGEPPAMAAAARRLAADPALAARLAQRARQVPTWATPDGERERLETILAKVGRVSRPA